MTYPKSHCLLAVHAHPDDESIGTGGALALYASRGARTILVTCTRGEEGEIVDDELKAQIADNAPSKEIAQERLANHRDTELAAAVAALNVTQAYQLGYRDSGMAGTESNVHPRAFTNVHIAEATARLIEIVRRERPQVMVSYDEIGGYGHPDHIMAHRIALLAYKGAANSEVYPQQSDETPPWQPLKFYYIAMSRGQMRRMVNAAQAFGIDMPFGNRMDAEERAILRGEPIDPDHPERPPFGIDDDAITTTLDIRSVLANKRAAMSAHRSQLTFERMLANIPDETIKEYYGTETFKLVRSHVATTWPEDDLFAGVE
jgi:N-acetyl-1-D-myo-inositol-2-amino-2-deoxy-alpha-D-glucopyranoside deacetylase